MVLYFWMLAFTFFVLLMISAFSIPILSGLVAGIVAGVWGPRWFADIYGIPFEAYMGRMYFVHFVVFLVLSYFQIKKKPLEEVAATDHDPLTAIYTVNLGIGCVVVCVISFHFFVSGLF